MALVPSRRRAGEAGPAARGHALARRRQRRPLGPGGAAWWRSPRWRLWRRAVAIPVVGMGGVQSAAHARDLLDVGATLVAVGTESFRDPAAGARIARELAP